MKALLLAFLCITMTGCTYTISMAHTEGTASDVIDETESQLITPTVTVPIS